MANIWSPSANCGCTNKSITSIVYCPFKWVSQYFEDSVKQLLTWVFYLRHISRSSHVCCFFAMVYFPIFNFRCFGIPFSCLLRAISFLSS
jgi:hypothetical protein